MCFKVRNNKKNTNPYYLNNEPHLRDSLCAYIDILGYSDSVLVSYENGKEDKYFKKLFHALNGNMKIFHNSFPDLINRETHFIKVLTDNIVIGYPIETGHGENEFGDLITMISYYQASMALSGLFVRGAIVRGSLFMDDSIVYGKSIINAYQLESKYAVVPRIILSDEVYKLVQSHLKFYSNPRSSPQYNHIYLDNDNYAFLNYLSVLDPEYLYWNEVRKHRKYVEYFIRKYHDNPYILSKYTWIANYHNYFVRGYISDPNYNDKYLVNKELLDNKPKRISV